MLQWSKKVGHVFVLWLFATSCVLTVWCLFAVVLNYLITF